MKTLSLMSLACGCLVFGSGCATSFHPVGVSSDYYVKLVAMNSYRIYYEGGPAASEERIVDFALLRACHLTKYQDCKYFAIINQTLSGIERTVYDAGTTSVVLGPNSSLVIQCFSFRPKDVFVFNAHQLEAIIRRKYRPGESPAPPFESAT